MNTPELNALFSISESLTDLDDTLHAALLAIKSLRRAIHLNAVGRGSFANVEEALTNYRYTIGCAIPENFEATEEAIAEVVSHFA